MNLALSGAFRMLSKKSLAREGLELMILVLDFVVNNQGPE